MSHREPCGFPGCHLCPESPNFLLPLQEYIQKLMPPLIQKWNELKDEDKDLFPLLEVGGLPAPSHSPAPPPEFTSPAFLPPVSVIRGHCPAERLPALLRARLPALRHASAEDTGPGHGEHPPARSSAAAPAPAYRPHPPACPTVPRCTPSTPSSTRLPIRTS